MSTIHGSLLNKSPASNLNTRERHYLSQYNMQHLVVKTMEDAVRKGKLKLESTVRKLTFRKLSKAFFAISPSQREMDTLLKAIKLFEIFFGNNENVKSGEEFIYGAGAVLICSKMYESQPISITKFTHELKCSKEQILFAEAEVARACNFFFSPTTEIDMLGLILFTVGNKLERKLIESLITKAERVMLMINFSSHSFLAKTIQVSIGLTLFVIEISKEKEFKSENNNASQENSQNVNQKLAKNESQHSMKKLVHNFSQLSASQEDRNFDLMKNQRDLANLSREIGEWVGKKWGFAQRDCELFKNSVRVLYEDCLRENKEDISPSS